ncbi:MAG: hypothetical protein ACO2XZ_05710 [Rickettsiales bacterium]
MPFLIKSAISEFEKREEGNLSPTQYFLVLLPTKIYHPSKFVLFYL